MTIKKQHQRRHNMNDYQAPHDDLDDAAQNGGFAGRLRGFLRHPIVIGLLFGLLFFAAYGVFLHDSGDSKKAASSVSVLGENDLLLDAGKVLGLDSGLQETDVTDVTDVPRAPDVVLDPTVPVVWEYAIVLADMGMQRRILNAMQESLPANVGVAVSVYSPDLQNTLSALVNAGHQVWLQLATQGLGASPNSGVDAGGLALLAKAPAEQNRAQLERQLAGLNDKVRGLYIRSNADITLVPDVWGEIAHGLINRRYMVLDATLAPISSKLYSGKGDEPMAYLKSHVLINGSTDSQVGFKEQLVSLANKMVSEQERIIVIENATAKDMPILREWIDGLAAKGIVLVKASKFSNL